MYLFLKRILSGLVLLGLTGVAAAMPSGLNNIPTADAVPKPAVNCRKGAPLPVVGFDKRLTKECLGMKGEERDLFTLRTI